MQSIRYWCEMITVMQCGQTTYTFKSNSLLFISSKVTMSVTFSIHFVAVNYLFALVTQCSDPTQPS